MVMIFTMENLAVVCAISAITLYLLPPRTQ